MHPQTRGQRHIPFIRVRKKVIGVPGVFSLSPYYLRTCENWDRGSVHKLYARDLYNERFQKPRLPRQTDGLFAGRGRREHYFAKACGLLLLYMSRDTKRRYTKLEAIKCPRLRADHGPPIGNTTTPRGTQSCTDPMTTSFYRSLWASKDKKHRRELQIG